MCGGGRARSPRIVQQGPSAADMQRQQDALNVYRDQAAAQQQQLAAALQQQIDDANKRMAEQQAQLAAETAAAAADVANRQVGSYAVKTTAEVAPAGAQTTEPIKPRAKRGRNGLAIAANPAATTSGTGLNIGM